MRNDRWLHSRSALSISVAVLFALFLIADRLHACCMAMPIVIEDPTIISSTESNTIVRFSYRSPITVPVDPDSHLKEKTVSTTDMISDIVNRYVNSSIVTIGMVNGVETYYSEFGSEGYSYHCERVEVTIERVLKGNIGAGDYEFTYRRSGDSRQIVYDSITGESDTLYMLMSPDDPGYRGLKGKRFLHFSSAENPEIADYVMSNPRPCEEIHGFFLNQNDDIVFTNIEFRDTNDFTIYPLLSVPVEQMLERVQTLDVNPGHRSIAGHPNAMSCTGKWELYTVTGRRVTVPHGRSSIDGVAAGMYLRRIDGGTQRKNLHLNSDVKR